MKNDGNTILFYLAFFGGLGFGVWMRNAGAGLFMGIALLLVIGYLIEYEKK